MRVLMLNNEYPPVGGGTGTVNKKTLEGLKFQKDIYIDLITGSQGKKNEFEQLADNIRIFKIGLDRKNIHHASNVELAKYAFKAFLMSRKLHRLEKYDVSFSWSTVPAGFVSLLLYFYFNLNYILRVGGPDIPGFEKRYAFIYKLISPLIKLIWRKSKLIITKCRTEREMVLAINPKLNVQIVPNGVDTGFFKPIIKTFVQPLKLICAARLIKRKGQDLLIRAVAALKQQGFDIEVDLVGDGDEFANFRKLVKELDVQGQINFCGYIPNHQMHEYYQKADVFVLPSYNEGMSNALLEAMACGLPVVVTNVGGTYELVKDGENGFVFNPGGLDRLIQILKTMSTNPQLLEGMGKNSRKSAEPFDWQGIVYKYLNVISNICSIH
jgi:phosphatidyl-myo-inositol dimannoside synthase